MKTVFYEVNRGDNMEFYHLEVKVSFEAKTHDAPVVMTWQGNVHDVTVTGWYGGHMHLKIDRPVDIPDTVALAKAICNKPHVWSLDMKDVMARLKKIGTRVVYDPRVNFVLADQVPGVEFQQWGDAVNSEITVDCLARNREEAQKLIAIELFKESEAGQYDRKKYKALLDRFEAQERPVRMLNAVDHLPPGLDELLALKKLEVRW